MTDLIDFEKAVVADVNDWRLLLSGREAGASNMALDEALLQSYSNRLASSSPPFPAPILRFYGWLPACLSLGYAQKAEREVNFEACRQLGVDWVRRPTGGRAILHDHDELTYSLVGACGDPLFGSGILDSYYRISQALLEGLQRLGVQAEVAPKVSSHQAAGTTAACFDAPSSYEITFGGRKLIGSAQSRSGAAFLQQGTILLRVDVQKLFQVLNPPQRLSRAAAIEQVSQRLTSIMAARGRIVDFGEAQAAFIAGFEAYFNIHLTPSQPTSTELEFARRLRLEKYANPAWNMERQRPRPVLHQ